MSIDLLAGVRVLEVAMLSPDALGGHLADLGADVIKVEQPPGGDRIRAISPTALGSPDGVSLMHLRLNRGKRSIALNLKEADGRTTFLELARRSDVVIEGLRPGTLRRWGITFATLHEANPALIICSLSGFGGSGPYKDLPTHGVAYDAFAGLNQPEYPDADGNPRMPALAPMTVGINVGPLQAAVGVLAALVRARRTGRGAVLEVAQADAAALWDPEALERAANAQVVRTRRGYGSDRDGHVSLRDSVRYSYYRTSDDRVILFQATERKFWQNFCRAIDRSDLLSRFPGADYDHASGNEQLRKELQSIFAQRSQADWVDLMIASGVPGGPVLSREELPQDRHFLARDNMVTLDHPELGPLRMTGTPLKIADQRFDARPAPKVGEHTADVLAEVLDEPPRADGSPRVPGADDNH